MKADYLSSSGNIFNNIQDNYDFIKDEALIINHCKCELLLSHQIDDFSINGISVYINEYEGGYILYFKNHSINIEVINDEIINYRILS